MKEYKRFTERVGKSISIKETSTNDNRSIWNALERLAELEDKIEDGTIIELPCKVGETVYFLVAQGKLGTINTTGKLIERTVDKIIFNGEKIEICSERKTDDDCILYGYLGDIVFLTKAEAEKKLAELKGGVK